MYKNKNFNHQLCFFYDLSDHCAEKLPEPIKLREAAAKEQAKLSEFQEELVLMAATLNGDHRKSIYPDKLIENMCVTDAVKYVEDAFNTFLNECEKARQNGADGSEIVDCADTCSTQPNSKSFLHKVLSCITCDR
jgi:phospholipase C